MGRLIPRAAEKLVTRALGRSPVVAIVASALHRFLAMLAHYFWATHNGAELDLLLSIQGRRIGVEIKRVDAPRRTRSMAVAVDDLRLDALYVVYPGEVRYAIDERITAVPAGAPFPAWDPGLARAAPAPSRAGE